MTIEQLEQAGRLLYGDQWQSNMARDLNIDSRRIRQWVSGERSVSDWVLVEIQALLDKKKFNINRFLDSIKKDCRIMSNFINKLDGNMAMLNKVANNPNSPVVAQAVQSQLKSIVISVYKNNIFNIAGLDKDGKALIQFTASKDDEGLVFWFGEDWKDKVIKIERIGDADELVKIDDIA